MRFRVFAIVAVAAIAYYGFEHRGELPSISDPTSFIIGMHKQVSPYRFKLVTFPEPPTSEGATSLRLRITDTDGQPADGLVVEANFSLSEVSREMKSVRLLRTGKGTYDGKVELDIPGTWEMNVIITKKGQMTREKLNVEVTAPQGSPEPSGDNDDDS